MKKRGKKYFDKAVLALVLIASLCLTPLQSAVAYAEAGGVIPQSS